MPSLKTRAVPFLLSALVIVVAGLGLYVAVGRSGHTSPTRPAAINHIVILLRENHTYDNLIGRFPGGDGTSRGRNFRGKLVPLDRTPQLISRYLGHTGPSADVAINDGQSPGRITCPTRRVTGPSGMRWLPYPHENAPFWSHLNE